MNFLKGLAISLLSFLLFLSLSIFSSAFMLNNTLLDPDFVTAEINRLDMSSLAEEFLSEQIPQEESYIVEVLDKTITDLEPWIKEQVSTAIYTGYDYLMGTTQSLSLTISIEPVKDSLKENLREALLASPPSELKGMSPAIIEQYSDEVFQQLIGDIEPTFEFTESSLPPDVLAILEQVRQGMDYYQLGYKALIGFMLLLVLGIILISRQVRDITRRLGIPCLTYGAFGYVGIFVAKYFAERQLPLLDVPASLETWIPQFVNNLLAPLETFCLGLLIGGIVLIIVSIVYRRRQAPTEE
ncbi:hypothetical protein ES703_75243 [subsurface metagenome]